MSISTPDRLVHIDAMRAIAALLVVWIHLAETLVPVAGSGGWVYSIARDLNAGGIGVTIFFLISGFVIPSSLRTDRPRREELRVFVIRRFFRLYPAFWFSVPFALAAIWWAFGKPVSLELIVANLTMAGRPLGFQLIQLPYWTLFVELVFYLLCAVLFAVGLLRSSVMLLAMAAFFAAIYLSGYVPGVLGPWNEGLWQDAFPAQLSIMFCGALLRRWQDGQLPEAIKLGTFGMLSLWLVYPLAIGLTFVDGHLGFVFSNIEVSKAIGIALFLLLAFALKPRFRPLVALGQASYSLYLFHSIVAFAMLWLVQQAGFGWLGGWHTGLYVLVGTLVSLPLAFAVHAFVERPAIALGRNLSRARGASAERSSPRLHA